MNFVEPPYFSMTQIERKKTVGSKLKVRNGKLKLTAITEITKTRRVSVSFMVERRIVEWGGGSDENQVCTPRPGHHIALHRDNSNIWFISQYS